MELFFSNLPLEKIVLGKVASAEIGRARNSGYDTARLKYKGKITELLRFLFYLKKSVAE